MSTDRPRARRDLLVSHQSEGDKEFVVVKDPRSRQYLKLRPPEWWLVGQMDGTRSVAELSDAFASQFQASLPPESLAKFVERLDTLGILEGERAEKAAWSLAQRQPEERGLGRILMIKLKAVDPDRWLGAWARRLRYLFRPWFWPVSALVIVGALGIVAANQAAFRFDLAGILQGSSIPILILSIFLIVALHEIAHGLTCRYLGGRVNEMGFLLLYFQPCLYCDLSDAWLFKEKWKKLLVTFSGAYFQVLLGALAVWGWRITTLDTWPNHLLWLVAVVSLFNVLFNFNPLIKLDGYYLLSDGLGVPNLRARSFQWLTHCLLGREWSYAERPDRRERRIYWSYGIGAVVYSALLLGYLAWWVLDFMVGRWRGMGLLLYLTLAEVIFRRPIARAVRAAVPEVVYKVRKVILWGLVGLALLAAVLIPFAYRVGSPAHVEPWAQLVISVLPDGYVVTEWYDHGEAELTQSKISKLVASGFTTLSLTPLVAVGDSIAVGDTVLRISADQFASFLEETQAERRAKEAELELLLSDPKPEEVAEARARILEEESLLQQTEQNLERTRSLADRNMTPQSTLELAETAVRAQAARLESARQSLALLLAPPKTQEVRKLQAEVQKLARQVTFYGGQLEATVFTSPVPGRVLRLSTRGGEVCRIARTDSIRCVLDVEEADAPLLAPGQEITLKIRSAPFASYSGTLVHVSPLGDTAAGTATFAAVATLANPGTLSPGMTGYAKVLTGRHTLAWRVVRSLARFIRIEFWSWW